MSENNYSDVLNRLLEKYKSEDSKESSNESPSNETQPNGGSIHTDANADNSSKINEPNSEDSEKVETTTVKQRAKLEDEIDRNFSNSPDAHARDQKIKERSANQTLDNREELIQVLKRLFRLQLVFMNIVVVIIAIWSVFDIPWFHEIDLHIYDSLCSFLKYYVSAVLVEMLSALIFIIHQVFSKKDYD